VPVLGVSCVLNTDTVTISPKFQIVIPQKARERLGLASGEKLRVFVYDGRIELIPVRPVSSLRGSLKGMDTDVGRDL
jgi:AbrB family looped-hinge helix DNA binding protein